MVCRVAGLPGVPGVPGLPGCCRVAAGLPGPGLNQLLLSIIIVKPQSYAFYFLKTPSFVLGLYYIWLRGLKRA